METQLPKFSSLYSCNNNINPEDGLNAGRNMLVRTL